MGKLWCFMLALSLTGCATAVADEPLPCNGFCQASYIGQTSEHVFMEVRP